MRGALLIVAAVLLGAGLQANGFRDANTSAKTGTTPTTKPGSATTTPTSAVVQAHDPAQVKVLVLNASGKQGVAGGASEQLKALNYTLLDAGNAKGPALTTSIVYFVPGYDADAQSIAAKLSLPASAAQPLPTPVPEAVGDARDANVVIVIGTDAPIAGGAGTGTATTTATTTAN
jgi:hypothetical protein